MPGDEEVCATVSGQPAAIRKYRCHSMRKGRTGFPAPRKKPERITVLVAERHVGSTGRELCQMRKIFPASLLKKVSRIRCPFLRANRRLRPVWKNRGAMHPTSPSRATGSHPFPKTFIFLGGRSILNDAVESRSRRKLVARFGDVHRREHDRCFGRGRQLGCACLAEVQMEGYGLG